MGTRLFVGGLSWGTTDETLRGAFEPYGSVQEARVVLDRDTGRSRGFGFVRFADAEEAALAIEKMNGASLDGRTIRVNEADDRKPPPNRGNRFNREGGNPGVVARGAGGPRFGGAPNREPGPPRSGPPRGRFQEGEPDRVRRPGGPPPAPEVDPASMAAPPRGMGFGEEVDDDRPRRRPPPARKKRGPTDEELRFNSRAAKKPKRRESGRTWRDYDLDDDE